MIRRKPFFSSVPQHVGATVVATLAVATAMPIVSIAAVTDDTVGCSEHLAPAFAGQSESHHFARAQRLAQNGNYRAARIEFEALTASAPENVDYWFGLAQVQYWSGDATNALLSLARARELAPDYEQVWYLELTILAAQQDEAAGLKAADLRTAARVRFPAAIWLDEFEVTARPSFRWEAGADIDWLNNQSDNWQRKYVYVDVPFGDGDTVYASIARYERFDLTDNQLGIGASVALAGRWYGALDAQFSSGADFLPESMVSVNLGSEFGQGWTIAASLRDRRYPEARVLAGGLSIERYFEKIRVAYLGESSRLESEIAVTHRATINLYLESGTQFGVTVAIGDEIESVSAGQVLKTRVNAIALSGRHPFGRYLSIIWRLGAHQQGSLYNRYTAGLSIAGGY